MHASELVDGSEAGAGKRIDLEFRRAHDKFVRERKKLRRIQRRIERYISKRSMEQYNNGSNIRSRNSSKRAYW